MGHEPVSGDDEMPRLLADSRGKQVRRAHAEINRSGAFRHRSSEGFDILSRGRAN